VELSWQAITILAFIHFIARPLKIVSATLGTSITWQEKALISWIGPRGIIAAAVSALFALRLQQENYPDADLLVSLTFVVIIGTVVFQSLTAKPLAAMLGVIEQAPRGMLIVGANPVCRTVAKAIQENGFDVLLADSYHSNVRQARMAGLKVFHGNPVSRLADKELDLIGFGTMLGMSQNDDLNVLAVQRYRNEFGKKRVFSLPSQASQRKSEREVVSEELSGVRLFSPDMTYSKLASLVAQGAEMRTTNISEEFTLADYAETYGSNAIPMFILNKDLLKPLSDWPTEEEAVPGSKIIAMVKMEKNAEVKKPEAKS